MLVHTVGKAQDNLIYIESQAEAIKATNLTITEGVIKFAPIDKEGVTMEMNIGNVKEVIFNKEKPDEIITQQIHLKSKKCFIDKINNKHVNYHLSSGESEKIESKKVFYISFLNSSPVPEINEYENVFVNAMSKFATQSVKAETRTGTVEKLTTLPELKKGIIRGKTIYNDVSVDINMATENISRLLFEPIPYKNRLKHMHFHLLTSDNEWETVSSIDRISPRKILYSKPDSDLKLNIEKKKADISALFFYNPKELKLQHSPVINNDMELNQAYLTEVRLDVNAGFGYMLADAPDGMSATQKRYYDELRSGFTFDADLVVYPWKSVGFGARFNSFSTKNRSSADDYIQFEDNISVAFLGGGISFKTDTRQKDATWGYIDLMAGYMSVKNNFELENESFSLKGSSIGYYLSPGLNLKLDKSVYLILKAGLMLGGIKKFEVEGEEMELSDPDSMSRFDAMGGLSIKF